MMQTHSVERAWAVYALTMTHGTEALEDVCPMHPEKTTLVTAVMMVGAVPVHVPVPKSVLKQVSVALLEVQCQLALVRTASGTATLIVWMTLHLKLDLARARHTRRAVKMKATAKTTMRVFHVPAPAPTPATPPQQPLAASTPPQLPMAAPTVMAAAGGVIARIGIRLTVCTAVWRMVGALHMLLGGITKGIAMMTAVAYLALALARSSVRLPPLPRLMAEVLMVGVIVVVIMMAQAPVLGMGAGVARWIRIA